MKKDKEKRFNLTNDSIGWARWTWNPITGCRHGCSYCYARAIALHYPKSFPKGFEPDFHEDRLTAPFNTRMPQGLEKDPGGRNVFCVSMGDMFGDWVPVDWINRILDVIRKTPQWNYIILTKNPKRLPEFSPFPPNTWIGATVDRQARVTPTEEAFRNVKAQVKFVSCEPLQEEIRFNHLELFNWLIIGGLRRGRAEDSVQPDWPWLILLFQQVSTTKCKVYCKPNLTMLKQYPD